MKQNPFGEASRFSASQDTPHIFFGTWRFITTFTRDRHLSLSWAKFEEYIIVWRRKI